MVSTTIDYVGSELELFSDALRWKSYMRDTLGRHFRGDVGEVGAGLGATTKAFANLPDVRGWTCIEPDPGQSARLADELSDGGFAYPVRIHTGTLEDLAGEPTFDTIIYIDVLEHIRDDVDEVRNAFKRLRPGGRIVVLGPAWPLLYSPFDRAIGHYRRYTRRSMRAVKCNGLVERAAFYMDGVGMFASLVNKALLRQSMPTKSQIALWDRVMVPVSRWIDPLVGRSFGKSVVVVWERPA